jgi:hypothetical protein
MTFNGLLLLSISDHLVTPSAFSLVLVAVQFVRIHKDSDSTSDPFKYNLAVEETLFPVLVLPSAE